MNRAQSDRRDRRNQTAVEYLLGLGRVVQHLLRHGHRLDTVTRDLRVGDRACLLALAFLAAPASIKFRALVEDWRLLSIRAALRTLDPPFPF